MAADKKIKLEINDKIEAMTICIVPDCSKEAMKRMKHCQMHYYRLRKYGSLDLPYIPGRKEGTKGSPNIPTEGYRTCTKCYELKPVDEFHKSKAIKSDGRMARCIECNKQIRAEIDPDTILSYQLKHRMGITLAEYNELLTSQGGGCAICGKKPGKRMLSIDHDHNCCPGERSCGQCVRGLLCLKCNSGIGYFDEDEELMIRAIEYVRAHK